MYVHVAVVYAGYVQYNYIDTCAIRSSWCHVVNNTEVSCKQTKLFLHVHVYWWATDVRGSGDNDSVLLQGFGDVGAIDEASVLLQSGEW